MPARVLGLIGVALGGFAAYWSAQGGRRAFGGPALAIVLSLFTGIVGGRPKEDALLRVGAGAPLYDDKSGILGSDQRVSGSAEAMAHPGPVALSSVALSPLTPRQVVAGAMVAAAWDGAWFAGRVLSVGPSLARIHFLGWESEWDKEIPPAELRGLPSTSLPRADSGVGPNILGSRTPLPSALLVQVHQPSAGLGPDVDLKGLTSDATLYAQRLDVANAPVATALPGVSPDKPFALVATGALRFDAAGTFYFGIGSDGATKLWVDDGMVAPGAPVSLTAGAHQLRVEYRHVAGPTVTLGLRLGTDPKALHPIDMNRQGVAQAARDPDGSLRLVLGEGILFDLDKDELNPSAERALASVFATNIGPFPSASVAVEGHTDDQGSDDHNLDLSRRRAERVAGWLVARGRSAASVTKRAFGEQRPRFPNDSEAHRHSNRRVELVVAPAPFAPASGAAAAAPSPAPADTAPLGRVAELLGAYYRDLNGGTFEANRYFEPNVERFITFTNTSAGALNDYIRNTFPKQFKQHRFGLEDGTLKQESPGQYVYVEQSHYIMAGKTQPVDKRVSVRIRLSPGGKLVFFHQFQVLR